MVTAALIWENGGDRNCVYRYNDVLLNKESHLHGKCWGARCRIHDMCTAINRVLLRKYTGLFNDNLSTAKVKLPTEV